jgi:hypothetical protein
VDTILVRKPQRKRPKEVRYGGLDSAASGESPVRESSDHYNLRVPSDTAFLDHLSECSFSMRALLHESRTPQWSDYQFYLEGSPLKFWHRNYVS